MISAYDLDIRGNLPCKVVMAAVVVGAPLELWKEMLLCPHVCPSLDMLNL